MNKKELIKGLIKADCRIAQLEQIICPGGKHDWEYEETTGACMCKKCGKGNEAHEFNARRI